MRIEYKHKLFLSGAVGSMSQSEKDSIRRVKPLLVLIVPEDRNFAISQILEGLERIINHSGGLIVDAGYEMHSADLKALPAGHVFFESIYID